MNIDELRVGISELLDEFNKTNRSIVKDITINRIYANGREYNSIVIGTVGSIERIN